MHGCPHPLPKRPRRRRNLSLGSFLLSRTSIDPMTRTPFTPLSNGSLFSTFGTVSNATKMAGIAHGKPEINYRLSSFLIHNLFSLTPLLFASRYIVFLLSLIRIGVRWGNILVRLLNKYRKKLSLKVQWRPFYDSLIHTHFSRPRWALIDKADMHSTWRSSQSSYHLFRTSGNFSPPEHVILLMDDLLNLSLHNYESVRRHTFILSKGDKQKIWETVERLLQDSQVEVLADTSSSSSYFA
ncbi:hypothetical protein V6N13_013349 [Hibiscus sabdariffa]